MVRWQWPAHVFQLMEAFRSTESLEPPLRENILNSFLIAATNKNAHGFLGKKATHDHNRVK